ncbi:MAG: M81 family metallopeptidase [Pseudomonadales bacterium]|jgi:microcystin degradation protein MlrC|nr:M81 family metallopeptidase [Pseudomonadales bacterium]
MHIFFATLGTETNTFSPIPAGWSVWRETLLRRRGDGDATVHAGQRSFRPLFEVAARRRVELLPGLQAFAAPSGPTPAAVRATLEAELLADLDAAAVDGVLLHLHGAMVADDEDDCEGALLERVRGAVGPRVPVAALLDLHCHLTPRMLDAADLLFGYREYPHVDTFTRLGELLDALCDLAEGRTRPVMALADCAMIGTYPTTTDAMGALVEEFRTASAAPGMIDAWLGHGFPWGDVAALGTRVLAIADGDEALARAEALRLAEATSAARETIANRPFDLDGALVEALATDTTAGPVVIADAADNTGGGAPGDSTFFLAALLERRIAHAAIGPLYDPGAVTLCHDAGVGAELDLRIGGKLCPESGAPVDARVEVLAVTDDLVQTLNAAPAHLGPSAAVRLAPDAEHGRHEGPLLVLVSRRIQAGSPELFTRLGIEPAEQRILVVKSSQHFHAGFAPLASRVLYSGAPGALAGDVTRIRYRRAPVDRLWPFDDEPRPGILYP